MKAFLSLLLYLLGSWKEITLWLWILSCTAPELQVWSVQETREGGWEVLR